MLNKTAELIAHLYRVSPNLKCHLQIHVQVRRRTILNSVHCFGIGFSTLPAGICEYLHVTSQANQMQRHLSCLP